MCIVCGSNEEREHTFMRISSPLSSHVHARGVSFAGHVSCVWVRRLQTRRRLPTRFRLHCKLCVRKRGECSKAQPPAAETDQSVNVRERTSGSLLVQSQSLHFHPCRMKQKAVSEIGFAHLAEQNGRASGCRGHGGGHHGRAAASGSATRGGGGVDTISVVCVLRYHHDLHAGWRCGWG